MIYEKFFRLLPFDAKKMEFFNVLKHPNTMIHKIKIGKYKSTKIGAM